MKTISLTKGKSAMVDDADYDELIKFKWHVLEIPIRGLSYAIRTLNNFGKTKKMYMHRVIMGEPTGFMVDHINHDGLDNRKENLRICTHRENQQNRSRQRNQKYKYIGVRPYGNRFIARIYCKGETITVGYFKTEIEAAKARDYKAFQIRGKFANLNFQNSLNTLGER